MEYVIILVVGGMIGKSLGRLETIAALKLHEVDVRLAKERAAKEKIERRIQRLERKQLRFKNGKEDVNP